MPRSRSRGARLNRYRNGETLTVACRTCGRSLGYLSPDGFTMDRRDDAIWWVGSESVSPPAGGLTLPDVLLDMLDHRRRRYRCVCGAVPLYTQPTLRTRYDAAKAAGDKRVDL